MKPLLLGFTVRALAHSAVAAGFSPVAVDWFGDRDLVEVCPQAVSLCRVGLPYTPAALAAAAAPLSFTALAYTGGLENHPEVVEGLARRATLLGNPPAVLRAVRDWRQVSAALAAAGFRVPRSLPPGAAVPAQGVWLEKPVRSAGGLGIRLAVAGSVPADGTLVQEFLPGTPGSVLFVADGWRAQVLGVTEQLAAGPPFGGRPFQYTGNILLPAPPRRLREQLAELCQFLTARYGLVGLNGVDFVRMGDDPVPVEVNPRYTAAMELVERAAAVNLFALHLAGCAGRCPPPLPAWTGYYGKAIVYALSPGVWRFAGPWRTAGLRDVPWPGDPLPVGGPVCTVLAAAADRNACLAALQAAASAVRSEWVAPGTAAHQRSLTETGDQLEQRQG